MHGYTYHFKLDPKRNTIKLKPTAGTYLKAYIYALAPLAVITGFIAIATVAAERQMEKDTVIEAENFLKD